MNKEEHKRLEKIESSRWAKYDRDIIERYKKSALDTSMDEIQYWHNFQTVSYYCKKWSEKAIEVGKPTKAIDDVLDGAIGMHFYHQNMCIRFDRYKAEFLEQRRMISSLAKDKKELEKQVKILREEVKFLEKT